MLAKQVYHTATPYIISRQRYIIENNNKLWYNQLDKLEFVGEIMIILITGASHTGKTVLAQKLLEKYKYSYLSIDHLKMGLIRSKNTENNQIPIIEVDKLKFV